jgi:membrane protein implicated in regulation of membrane protease activity
VSGLRPWEWALLAAVVLAAIEVLSGAFVALSLAIGCLAVAAAEWLWGGAGIEIDAVAFAAASGLAVLLLRRLFARPGDSRHAQGDVNEY